MTLGLLFIAAAGGLFAFNRIIDKKAGETANIIYESVSCKSPMDRYFSITGPYTCSTVL